MRDPQASATLTPLQRLWLLPEQVEGTWSARRVLAEQLRLLADRCVRSEGDVPELEAATALVNEAIALLPQGRTAAEAFADASYFAHPAVYVDRGALLGRSNPIAPPLRLTWEAPRSVCHVVLGEVYVGAPGMVHGGMVSAIFDQVFGHCVVMNGTSGLTGRLTVSYPRPTRLHRPLVFEAEVVGREGRQILLRGRCTDDGAVTAEADAVFIELDPERARSVIAGRPGSRS